MAPKSRSSAPSSAKTPSRIPLFYRIFFTWIEPLLALLGAFLYFFDGANTLRSITPVPLHAQTATQTPIETMLLWQVGSLYILFFALEFVILRHAGADRPDAWRVVQASILLGSDWGHLWGLRVLARRAGTPAWWWWPGAWTRWEDWGNLGMLWFGAGMRVAFLAGVGF